VRVIKAGRMELIEFHVADPTPCTPGHSDAITGGAVWIAGVKVNLTGSAGCQDDESGLEHFDMACGPIQYISSRNPVREAAQFVEVDQIDGNTVVEHFDFRMIQCSRGEGLGYCFAGGVGDMKNAPERVAAFSSQVEFIFIMVEVDTPVSQLGNGIARAGDGELDDLLITQACASHQGVLDMGSYAVCRIGNGRDAALSPVRRGALQIAFAQHSDASMVGKVESRSKACSTSSNNEDIGRETLSHEAASI